jgi:hypothetical protein
MTTLFVRHEVSDYATWRKVYDAFADRVPRRGVASALAVPSGRSREWISSRLAGW